MTALVFRLAYSAKPEGCQAGGTGRLSAFTFFGRATPDHAGACPYRVYLMQDRAM